MRTINDMMKTGNAHDVRVALIIRIDLFRRMQTPWQSNARKRDLLRQMWNDYQALDTWQNYQWQIDDLDDYEVEWRRDE